MCDGQTGEADPVQAARARRESRQGRASAGVAGRTGGDAGAADAHEDGGTAGGVAHDGTGSATTDPQRPCVPEWVEDGQL